MGISRAIGRRTANAPSSNIQTMASTLSTESLRQQRCATDSKIHAGRSDRNSWLRSTSHGIKKRLECRQHSERRSRTERDSLEGRDKCPNRTSFKGWRFSLVWRHDAGNAKTNLGNHSARRRAHSGPLRRGRSSDIHWSYRYCDDYSYIPMLREWSCSMCLRLGERQKKRKMN
jgi:hypothetical protein